MLKSPLLTGPAAAVALSCALTSGAAGTADVNPILIAPRNSKAIVPTIKKAQEKGMMLMALDSPAAVPAATAVPNPPDATNAFFATNSCIAGVLSGQYVEAAVLADFAGKPAKIATLNLFPGHTDTGVNLISDKPMSGVDSRDTTVGTDLCWGNK